MGHRRKCYMEKTMEEGIQERLLSEVPEGYYCIRGEMLITRLSVDLNIIAQYCRKSRITSPSGIKNLRSILNSLHRECGTLKFLPVNKAYQSVSYKAKREYLG